MPSMHPNTWLRTSVSSSAPMRPRRARRSDRAVKPEMSTKQHVASSSRQRRPGDSWSHSAARRGTYGVRASDMSAPPAHGSLLTLPTRGASPVRWFHRYVPVRRQLMRVKVDPEKCQGHNRCYAIAPELFDVDDYGNAHELNDGVVPA